MRSGALISGADEAGLRRVYFVACRWAIGHRARCFDLVMMSLFLRLVAFEQVTQM